MKKFFSQDRAQISIEMIIVLAAVVALVLIFVSQLRQTSAQGTKAIDDKTKKIFEEIDKI
jgi:competence protein ComGC